MYGSLLCRGARIIQLHTLMSEALVDTDLWESIVAHLW